MVVKEPEIIIFEQADKEEVLDKKVSSSVADPILDREFLKQLLEESRGEELQAKKALMRMRQINSMRSRKYMKRRRKEGFTRKNVWLNLNRKDADSCINWLKEQNPEALMDLVSSGINIQSLLNTYRNI